MAVPLTWASSSGCIPVCAAIWAPGVLGRTPGASSIRCSIQWWQVSQLHTSGPVLKMLISILWPHDLGRGCGLWLGHASGCSFGHASPLPPLV